jgi:hypothetical protein
MNLRNTLCKKNLLHTKEHRLWDSIYFEILEQDSLIHGRERIRRMAASGGGNRRDMTQLSGVWVTWVYMIDKTGWVDNTCGG